MRKLAAVFAVTCLAFATPAFATNGMRMIGFGPVQDSMGGVGVGATLDACSLVSNPAGISDLGWRLDVAGGYFKPTVSYSASGLGPPVVARDGATLDSSRGGSPIPAIGYVHPIDDRLAVGVGVFGVAGMGVDYDANLYGGPSLTSYLQGRLTPGVAYKVMEGLSVGLTANVMMAQMKYDVASGAGQALHDTATAFGLGATVGVKYSPVRMVTLGAAYETKSSFQDFSFKVPTRPNPFAAPGAMIPGGTDKLTLDQPQSATLGVAVTPVDMLLVAADVQWINWSDTMGKGLPRYSSDPNATGALPFDMGWSDQWVLKVGAQVTPMAGLQLRAGYNYGKMPLDPNRAFENLVFPAVSEHHVTAGVGYQATSKLAVNLTGVYAFNAKLEGANGAPPPPMGGTGQGITAYRTEMSQYEVELGVAYRF
jgi:long-chain fatty acid transport protein